MASGGTLPESWRSAFEQLADESPDGLWACDRELRCLYWNAAMERLSGLTAARVIGYGILEVLGRVTDGDADPREAIDRALGGVMGAYADHRLIGRGQAPVVMRTRYLPIRTEGGEVVGVSGMVRDATAEHRILQNLGETEARFRNMADASPVLLWMSRADGLCIFFNQTWLAFTGRTIEEEWGVGWAENVHFEDLEACMATYLEAFGARRVFEMEYRLRRKDGAYRWILDRGTPRYAPDGRFEGYIGSCVDITERRAHEADLRTAIEVRDDFLSVASHELGTPLTALKLHVEKLKRMLSPTSPSTPDPTLLKTRADLIGQEVTRLGRLVGTLLDTTRLAVGEWPLHLERLELGPLVDRVVRDLHPVAEKAQCAVTVDARATLYGRWDQSRLEQAFTNVLSNAFKYGAGGPVEVTVDGEGSTASARVRDHGVGLPPDEQELIFQRFGRAPHTRGYGGLGLGLWIARQSVEAMGGTIRVHSVPGKGATFEIVLRCEPPESPARAG
jgi:PAS domain S-box-containing protein